MEYIDKLNKLRNEKGLSFRQLSLECELSESTKRLMDNDVSGDMVLEPSI